MDLPKVRLENIRPHQMPVIVALHLLRRRVDRHEGKGRLKLRPPLGQPGVHTRIDSRIQVPHLLTIRPRALETIASALQFRRLLAVRTFHLGSALCRGRYGVPGPFSGFKNTVSLVKRSVWNKTPSAAALWPLLFQNFGPTPMDRICTIPPRIRGQFEPIPRVIFPVISVLSQWFSGQRLFPGALLDFALLKNVEGAVIDNYYPSIG